MVEERTFPSELETLERTLVRIRGLRSRSKLTIALLERHLNDLTRREETAGFRTVSREAFHAVSMLQLAVKALDHTIDVGGFVLRDEVAAQEKEKGVAANSEGFAVTPRR